MTEKLDKIPQYLIGQSLVGLGKSLELMAVKDNSIVFNFFGSLCKNFGSIDLLNSYTNNTTAIVGAISRSIATGVDDLLIRYDISEEHHLTKVVDAFYSGYLFGASISADPLCWQLGSGALFWGISKLMGSGDTIAMERNIAKESYNLATKIDKLSQGESSLVTTLHFSNALTIPVQLVRGLLGDINFDFGTPTTIAMNVIIAHILGNKSSEQFNDSLNKNLLETGPFANRLKFETAITKNPERAELIVKLPDLISQTKHLITVLPLKYQAATLGDSIAANQAGGFGFLYKALNNLFNVVKVDSLESIIAKNRQKERETEEFNKALKEGNLDDIKNRLAHKLESSQVSFWTPIKKFAENIIPIFLTSIISGNIQYKTNFELINYHENCFIGKKTITPSFLIAPALPKSLIDEHLGNPRALEDLTDILKEFDILPSQEAELNY